MWWHEWISNVYKCKKPDPKRYIRYDFADVTFCKRQIFRDGEENSSYKELELEEDWLQIWHIEEILG